MDQINSLLESCQRTLSANGRLSTAIPGFVARDAQVDLATAIANAINDQSILVAEAGTGTGKTYAYLVPCLLSGKKALISTATKTLQDQLFQKDIPTLIKALGLSIRVHNLKGRANYLCRHRIALYAEEGQFQTPLIAHEILHVRDKLAQMKAGERSELPEVSEDSAVWPYVTSTTENCLGIECSHYQECFLVKARKRALEADLVVINHHLFFADSRLKQEGFSELLPGVGVVIFDEAHQLADIATHFYGKRLGTRQFRDLLDDMIREWPVLDLANQPLKILYHQAEQLLDTLWQSVAKYEEKISWEVLRRDQAFVAAWASWLTLKQELLTCLNDDLVEQAPNLLRCKERLLEFEAILSFFDSADRQHICWMERFKATLIFHATPYQLADSFSTLLKRQECAYVFTSATLTMADSFDCFCKPLGLQEVTTLLLPSPFNFQEQALLYLPRGLPDPKVSHYYEALLAKALPIINASGGRCFFLFTSHKSLKMVAQMMSNKLNYPLLIQGDEAKPILLERFRQLGNAVLLGTATFWEGVDVKGEALSCVIIDKLPFANPNDPVMRGKMAYLQERGLSGFDELSLPDAVLALKQGVGRLIRDVNDKGVLMIADPRLTGRAYGKQIFASLPALPKTRNEQVVLDFIQELALNNEPIST